MTTWMGQSSTPSFAIMKNISLSVLRDFQKTYIQFHVDDPNMSETS
jgi:hypothetical protein